MKKTIVTLVSLTIILFLFTLTISSCGDKDKKEIEWRIKEDNKNNRDQDQRILDIEEREGSYEERIRIEEESALKAAEAEDVTAEAAVAKQNDIVWEDEENGYTDMYSEEDEFNYEGWEGDSTDYYEDYYEGEENIERNWEDTI